jgi:hypothetical protein
MTNFTIKLSLFLCNYVALWYEVYNFCFKG